MGRYFDWTTSLKRFVRFDAARAEDVNDALDELSAGLEGVDTDVNRALKLPIGTADQTLNLTSGQRANLLLRFDANGNISAIAGGGRWRGDWVTGTLYVVGDYVRDAVSKNIYSTVTQHTSGTLAADISNGLMQLAINVVDVEAAKADAQAAASTATTQADIATTQASNAGSSAAAAQNWAIKTDGPVSGGDYSSKHYAQQAQAFVATIPAGSVNDSITTASNTWSASKINTELGLKVNATNGTASGLTLNDGYTEEIFAVTGTTPALSPTNGSIQTWTLTGASTPTAGTWANGQSMTLLIDDGTANTINWSSLAVTWKTNGGSAPTLLTTGLTVIQLWAVGNVIYGARVGDA